MEDYLSLVLPFNSKSSDRSIVMVYSHAIQKEQLLCAQMLSNHKPVVFIKHSLIRLCSEEDGSNME